MIEIGGIEGDEDGIHARGFTRSGVTAIQPFAQFLAGAEERRALFAHRNRLAGARIAAHARRPHLDQKAPKPRNSTRWPSCQRLGDIVQHGRHDPFHIAVVEMRIARGQPRNQFRFDHPSPYGTLIRTCNAVRSH